MAEDVITVTPPEKGGEPDAKLFTQAELDAKVADRLSREGVKRTELEKLQQERDTLLANEKKRLEAELTETEKLKKQLDDSEQEKITLASEKEEALKFKTTIELKETEKIDKEIESLTDNQKAVVKKLPLFDQMLAISEFKDVKRQPGNWGKGESGATLSREQALKAIQEKRDRGDNSWKEDYQKFQQTY